MKREKKDDSNNVYVRQILIEKTGRTFKQRREVKKVLERLKLNIKESLHSLIDEINIHLEEKRDEDDF